MDTRAARKGGSFFCHSSQLTALLAYPLGLVIKKVLAFSDDIASIMDAMKNYITAALLVIASLANASEVPERLIDALCIVESNNNPRAIGDSGRAYGILQVWMPVIVDVNRYHKTNYKHSDAFDPAKAREICRLYLSIYATEKRLGYKPTLQDYARIWNGGPNGYKNGKTVKYWAKVQRVLR